MAQFANMHASQFGLAPSEQRRPCRIDAGKIAVEIGYAEKIFGNLPNAVALAYALRDLLLQALVELSKLVCAIDVRGCLDSNDENPADPIFSGWIVDRAVADGIICVFGDTCMAPDPPELVFLVKSLSLAAQNGEMERYQLIANLWPDLTQGTAERLGMLVSQDRRVGIVIDVVEFRPPADGHRKAGGEYQLEAILETRRPGFEVPQPGRRPIFLFDEPAHFAAGCSRLVRSNGREVEVCGTVLHANTCRMHYTALSPGTIELIQGKVYASAASTRNPHDSSTHATYLLARRIWQ